MKTILISLALTASAVFAQAQPEGGNPPNGPRPGGPDGPRRPVPPLFAALDADKDGSLSAEEIANASAALKTLDKDKDGKISKEELRPPMPPRGEGGGGGEGRGEVKGEVKGEGKGEGRPGRAEGAFNRQPEGGPRPGNNMIPDGGGHFAGPRFGGGRPFQQADRRNFGPRFEGHRPRRGPVGPPPDGRE